MFSNTEELISSILFNGEDCEQIDTYIKITTREKCHKLTENISYSSINVS